MKVYGIWNGGSSYARGDIEHDLEVFDSIAAAERALADRERLGYSYRQHFEFVNREPEDNYCPVVGYDSEIELYFDNPTEHGEGTPDLIIKFGPREGIVRERVLA